MARPLRIEYEGALYHVTARGNERKRIYFTKTDYGKFREYIEGAQEMGGVKSAVDSCSIFLGPMSRPLRIEEPRSPARCAGRGISQI